MNTAQSLSGDDTVEKVWQPLDSSCSERSFFLRSSAGTLHARGIAARLPRGTPATLGSRVQDFFRREHDGPRLLVGALAFDRQGLDSLIQPALVSRADVLFPQSIVMPKSRWQVTAEPDASQYSQIVSKALKLIADSEAGEAGEGGLKKVVLARRLRVVADHLLDARYLASRLAQDPSIATFMVPLPDINGVPRTLVGGSPELLVAKRGRVVTSNPLAGSARRDSDPVLDRAAAEQLLKSDKDRREHLMVVEAILDNLAPYCAELSTPRLAQLQTTESMWHLGTKIEGKLKDSDVSSAELAACLHPTPAVGGSPREIAQDVIRQLEPFERGFYAGALGWTDDEGDGEWYVSLRCGEVMGHQIMLYAGAGIVAGSDPQAEAAETSAKFAALLTALGIDEHGRPLTGEQA